MVECLFNSWGYQHQGSRAELLCLFAQLILMSAMAVQIRAYGPLSSQDGGQPQLVALTCMRLCKSAGRQGVWGRSWSICTHVCVF